PPDGGGASRLDPAPCGAQSPCPSGRRCDLSEGACVAAASSPGSGSSCTVGDGDECAWGHQCVGESCKKLDFLDSCASAPPLELLDASLGIDAWRLEPPDLDGDGRRELVAVTDSLSILWGDGRAPSATDWVGPSASAVFADLDDDGDADLLVAHDLESVEPTRFARFRGDGAGGFEAWGEVDPFSVVHGESRLAMVDLDQDGISELISIADGVRIAPGMGMGQFGEALSVAPPSESTSAIPVALDSIAHPGNTELLVLWASAEGAGILGRWTTGAPLPTVIEDPWS